MIYEKIAHLQKSLLPVEIFVRSIFAPCLSHGPFDRSRFAPCLLLSLRSTSCTATGAVCLTKRTNIIGDIGYIRAGHRIFWRQ